MNFSDEQKCIGNSLKEMYNVRVLATAGSGKTTSIKYIYSLYNPDEIISMTFNKHLADESCVSIGNYLKKIKPSISVEDICFHTVHSMGNVLYEIPCPDNNGLFRIIKEDTKLTKDLSKIKVVIYDECQDMNDLFYDFLIKLIRDITILKSSDKDLRICLLGDDKQCINRFTGATTDYILNPIHYFSPHVQGEWKLLHLSTTYRLSKPIADFVNNAVKGVRQCTVISADLTNKPDYILGNMFSPKYFDFIIGVVDKYANKNYDNVALICKSVKSVLNPVHRFVNYLKHIRPDINIYRTKSDYETRDDKVIGGKMLVSSIHQMKGQERDVILYFLFDDSFYSFNKLSKIPEPTEECPNTVYVGLTRAKKHLILCHHNNNDFLPFIYRDRLNLYSNFITLDNLDVNRTYITELVSSKNITDIVSYVDIKTVNTILSDFSSHEILKGSKNILKFNNVLIQTNTDRTNPIYEDMSGLIGQIIPILANCKYYGLSYREYLYKVCSVSDFEGSYTDKYIKDFKKILKGKYISKSSGGMMNDISPSGGMMNDISPSGGMMNDIDIKEFVYAVHIYYSYNDRFLHELHQLKGNYTWIDADYRMYNICASRILDNMKSEITKGEVCFEFPIDYKFNIEPFEITVKGIIDCLHKNDNEATIIEYKCAEFKDSHILQLICYGCLYYIVYGKIAKLKLYYPLSDSTINVHIKDIDVNSKIIMNLLISQKTNTECDLGNINFTIGKYRGYSFADIFNEYKKHPEILSDIQTISKMVKNEHYIKECLAFLFYAKIIDQTST